MPDVSRGPQQGHVNGLIDEKSPYLLEHAHDPVHWYPWSDVALKKAKNDSKPVLLSIGYSSCHWCHRMRRESFEDERTAEVINRNFIAIKVDREERPEVDAYYMNAVQVMTGGGGWPLTVFLTPDLQPFYGGTYFPPEPRYGMPSFIQVLEFVARAWKERREEALTTSSQVAETLRELDVGQERADGELTGDLLDGAYRSLLASFDDRHGGFGNAPKFPLPLSISFMLRYYFRQRNPMALHVATKTLDALASGGVRDHVGGGFHRYSTDRMWLVPHFEKMLYDNALLSSVFTDAFRVTGSLAYSQVVRQTLGWLEREMQSPEGGFWSAQDADTTSGEGVYYTWTPVEIEEVLEPGEAKDYCKEYGVTRAGNFEGMRSILHREVGRLLAGGFEVQNEKLYLARIRRPRPLTDTKILTSWNGLAVSAFARAGAALQEDRYVTVAERAAEFVRSKCFKVDSLLRRFAGGAAGIPASLEDFSFFSQGLLDLFEVTGGPRWLEEAMLLTDLMTKELEDKAKGGFFMASTGIPGQMRANHDGPTPSGNSVAVMNLLRLSEITGNLEWRRLAERTLRFFQTGLREQPGEHAFMMGPVDWVLNGSREVLLVIPSRKDAAEMIAVAAQEYMPDAVLVIADSENYDQLAKVSPLLEGRSASPKPLAYVCRNLACQLPAGTPDQLREQLNPRGR